MAFESDISLQSLFKETDFSAKTVIAAVSGGSDSLALLFLLKDYLDTYNQHVRLVAVTVDHKLRPESTAEAQRVGDICKQYHIEHKIISWDDEKPASSISQEARLARYNLLCHVAKQYGSTVIMTGHTLDDQAETYEMRLKRSSQRGLASMARVALLNDKFRLIRPLLLCRRQGLRNYLIKKHMTWIDDPSNENEKYERVQIRKSMTDTRIEKARINIEIAREMRQLQAENIACLIDELSPVLKKDFLEFSPLSSEILHNKELGFALGVFAAIMGGAPFLPPQSQLEKLVEFAKSTNTHFNRMTLSGAVIEKGKHQWKIWRENRDVNLKTVDAFETIIWDGRFLIENNSEEPLTIEPATMALLKDIEVDKNDQREKMHYASLLVSPILRQKQNFDAPIMMGHMNHISNVNVYRIMNPFHWMASGDDFAMIDKLKPIFHQKYKNIKKN